MTKRIQLRPDEKVLFEGDVDHIKSKLSVSRTDAVVTNQRLCLVGGTKCLERSQITAVREEPHGLSRKVVFDLHGGQSLALGAGSHVSLLAAGRVLTGMADAMSMPAEPQLSSVKNGSAWLAAFSPLIAGALVSTLGVAVFGPADDMRIGLLVQLIIARFVLIWLFLKIDYLMLERQGFNVKRAGLASPMTFPVYLFSRASVFKQGKVPAFIFAVLFAADILAVVEAVL